MNISLFRKSYNELVNAMKTALSEGDRAGAVDYAKRAVEIARKIVATPGLSQALIVSYRKEIETLNAFISNSGKFVAATGGKEEKKEDVPAPPRDDSGEKLTLEEAMQKLHSLIGLKGVKDKVSKVMNQISVSKEREKRGVKTKAFNCHMVFEGNPGTGKTTVVRLIAQMYRALGVVKKGHFVEVRSEDLIGEYVGHSEAKTKKVIESALGGVLFIDEAYALAQQGNNSFGQAVVNTLLPAIENMRGEFVVILAGYGDEMEELLRMNPGFKSRFNTKIVFDDYTKEELFEIFRLQCREGNYRLTADAERAVLELIDEIYENRSEHFANGRQMRNLLEDICANQSDRLGNRYAGDMSRATTEELVTLDVSDVPDDYMKYTE